MAEDDVITARQFHASPGVEEWRILFDGARALWRTSSLTEGAAFVAAIERTAREAGRDPDVDVRPRSVTLRTSRPDQQLDTRDVALAQGVSAAARELGLTADPGALQAIFIAVAQAPGVDVRPFWNAAMGYRDFFWGDAIDPVRRGPQLSFQGIDRGGRGRTHIDVSVPAEVAESRVRAALAAGGRLVDDTHAPSWWTIASPDGHGVDIAPWRDTEG